MLVYKIVWEDRNGCVVEWVGTKKAFDARKAEIKRTRIRRPYACIEMVFSGLIEIPTNKADMLVWLNNYAG